MIDLIKKYSEWIVVFLSALVVGGTIICMALEKHDLCSEVFPKKIIKCMVYM